jgi:hypothetical protein
LGALYKEYGDPERALSIWRESIEYLTHVFAAIPAAVGDMIAGLTQSYISQCEALGREPDGALLAPVREVFERLKTQGEQS